MYPKIPDVPQVEAMLAVDRHGSMSAAARALGVPQQTVSTRVSQAERILGVPVFLRSPYGTVATEQGRALLDASSHFLNSASTFARVVLEQRGALGSHRFPVAVSNTVAEMYFPAWAATFHRLHPESQIAMIQGNSSQVRTMVSSGEVQLGIVEGGSSLHGLEEVALGTDELILVVPTEHPWAGREVTADELRREPLVVREPGSGSREVITTVLGDLAEPAGEFGSLSAQRSAIAQLGAPGIIAADAVADHIELGRLVQVATPGLSFERPLTAVRLRRAGDNADADALIAIARDNPPV